jgi:adenosylmethionine-8-amino-7-oxononanoate aminotransferase
MANLDIIERENLLDRGRELEDEIGTAFAALSDAPLVGEVRTGIGALAAVAFTPEALAEAPDLPVRLFAAGRERGVLVRPLGDGVAFSPALVMTREEVEHTVEVVGDALEAIARDVPSAAAAR